MTTKAIDNYSIIEAARITGVSEKTLRRVISCGALPAYKPGRAIRICKKDLDEWFLSTRLKPAILSDTAAKILTGQPVACHHGLRVRT